jgi:hypothetical protein
MTRVRKIVNSEWGLVSEAVDDSPPERLRPYEYKNYSTPSN